MDINQILQQLSPDAAAFLTQAMQQGAISPEEVVQLASSVGIDALEQELSQLMAGGPATPPGQPPVDAAAAGAMPQQPGMPPPGMPPGMPPDAAGMVPQAGPIPPEAQTAPPNPPAPTTGPPKPTAKPKKVPNYNPPPVKDTPKPTLDGVLEDAREGRDMWRERDVRIAEDYDLYHLILSNETYGDSDSTTISDTVLHRRTAPETLVSLVTSLTTAKNGKITVEMEPRSDGDEYEQASQASEDAVLSWRELDEERWLEESVEEPPLPRKEAGLAALEGGFGWCWYVDAEDEECPFQYEVIPLSQLYDVGHARMRIYELPVGRARRVHENIAKKYPITSKGKSWKSTDRVRFICWADKVWRAIVWEETGKASLHGVQARSMAGTDDTTAGGDDADDERWILKPVRHNYGFHYYNYKVWGGSPAEALNGATSPGGPTAPLATGTTGLLRYKGYGVLTMLRRTFRLMDLFISAVATGALSNFEPAYLREVPEGYSKLKLKKYDRRPGAENVVPAGEKATPLRWDVSAGPDATNLMNSLIAEFQDASSPALKGALGPSGIAQMASVEQASQQMVTPIIDALEKWYAMMHKQRLILALRYSVDEKYNKDAGGSPQTYFDSYAKRSYRGESYGQYGTLKPKDVQRSGVRVVVRYNDRNQQEEMALAQMCVNLVQAHLMSQETALRRMGVKNPKQEIQRIFTDGALMDSTVLKAIIEDAVINSENQQLINAWNKAFYADAMKPAQGSPPRPAGAASMPANQPATNTQGSSSAIQAPGAQAMGQQGY